MTMKVMAREEPAIYKVLVRTKTSTSTAIGDLVVSDIEQTGPDGSGEFDYIDIGSVNNQTKQIEGPKRLPCSEAPSRARQRVRAGDVLVSMTRPNLNAVALVPNALDGATASTGFHVLRAGASAESAWLFYAVQSPQFIGAMSDLVQGALYPAVRPKDIRAFSLVVPVKAAQREVVAYLDEQLSRLDASVAALHRVQANLKRYRASVLKSACEGRLVPTEAELARQEGRTFETGAQLLQRILAERRLRLSERRHKEPTDPTINGLPDVPTGWHWATMPQLGELNRGKSRHRPRDDRRLYGGPYPFVQTGDVRHADGVLSRHTQTYSGLGLEQSRLWPAGTLCITIAANIAETARLSYPACFPDSIVGFVCDAGESMTKWVQMFLATAKEDLETFAPGTAQKNINLEVLQSVAIPLPPLAEQHRIVAEADRRLSLIRVAQAQVSANLARAQRLRQTMLQAAFRTPAQAGQ